MVQGINNCDISPRSIIFIPNSIAVTISLSDNISYSIIFFRSKRNHISPCKTTGIIYNINNNIFQILCSDYLVQLNCKSIVIL